MLEPILGSLVREQVLLFIHNHGEGYAREISRFFKASLDSVQKQLKRLQSGYVLKSVRKGKTLIYSFNEDYQYLKALRVLLEGINKSDFEKNKEMTGRTSNSRKTGRIGKRVSIKYYNRMSEIH